MLTADCGLRIDSGRNDDLSGHQMYQINELECPLHHPLPPPLTPSSLPAGDPSRPTKLFNPVRPLWRGATSTTPTPEEEEVVEMEVEDEVETLFLSIIQSDPTFHGRIFLLSDPWRIF